MHWIKLLQIQITLLWEAIQGGLSVTWSSITDKPETFTPSAHTHQYNDIITSENINLLPENWANNEITVNCSNKSILCFGLPIPTTQSNFTNFSNASILITERTDTTIKFKCLVLPTETIVIEILKTTL